MNIEPSPFVSFVKALVGYTIVYYCGVPRNLDIHVGFSEQVTNSEPMNVAWLSAHRQHSNGYDIGFNDLHLGESPQQFGDR